MSKSVLKTVEHYKLFEEFKEACKNGDLDAVQRLLTNPKLNPAGGEFGYAWYQEPIKYATMFGHTDVVRRLLQDPRVNPANVPFEYIVGQGHTEIVRLLLQDGRANPAYLDRTTALSIAAVKGNLKILRLLLDDPRIYPLSVRQRQELIANILYRGIVEQTGGRELVAVRFLLADPKINPRMTLAKTRILLTIPLSELRPIIYSHLNDFEQMLQSIDHLIEKKQILKAAKNLKTLKAVGKHGFGNLPENVRLHMGSLVSGKKGPNLQSQINQLESNYYGPTRRTRKRKGLRKQKGGDFLLSSSLPAGEMCAVCLRTFAETPELIAFTTTLCNHTFHGDCLFDWCESRNPSIRRFNDIANKGCPLCRAPLGHDCEDVYAFKHKVLYDPTFSGNTKIAKIYEDQVNM